MPRLPEIHTSRRNSWPASRDTHADHFDGSPWVIVARGDGRDLLDQIIALADLAKDGMRARSRPIEEIQKGVVGNIDEELRPSRFWRSGVGHTEGAGRVGNLGNELVWNSSIAVAGVFLSIARQELGTRGRTSRPGRVRVWILGIGTSELVHEIRNDAVEVDAIVKTRVGQVNEVSAINCNMVDALGS